MASWAVEASLDAQLEQTDPDKNYGSVTVFDMQLLFLAGSKTYWNRFFMEFELSGFPESSGAVTDAWLSFYLTDAFNLDENVYIRRCTEPNVAVESEVTWNEYSAG